MASAATMGTVTSADGTTIAFERTGRGPPLVLVHGAAGDHGRWELFGVRAAFADHHTVYAVDRRGRGGSGDAAEYAIEREFEDVAAVVDSIDEPVNLLGHSFGALCSMEAALRTDNLRSLVLYEPPFPVGDHQLYDPEILAEMTALVDAGDDEAALVVFMQKVAGLSPTDLDALRSAPNWPDRVDLVHTVLREYPAPADYAFDPARFEALTTPTLLLAGGDSPPFYRDALAALDDALPDSRLVVFEGQGHVAMNTAPDRFVEDVLSFIRELR